MTQAELLSILEFVEKMQFMAQGQHTLSSVDSRWNIILYAMRRHLEGKILTQTALTMAANVPYGTAIRRITELIDDGYILKRQRSKTGKSFSLHPSKQLIARFEKYAFELKSHIGVTFGFNEGDQSLDDFYFGASYMASSTLSFPSALSHGIGFDKKLRILGPTDPTFNFLSNNSRKINEFCGGTVELVIMNLDDLRQESIRNASLVQSEYDLIAFDLPCIGEFVAKKIVVPLNDRIDEEKFNFADFHNAAWQGSAYRGDQYGIPIQSTSEVFLYRKDLFEEFDLEWPPRQIEDVLQAAKKLHRVQPGLSGIVMNYGPGTPVAHTFMLTMASMGQSIMSQSTGLNKQFEHARPMVNTEVGKNAMAYLLELLDYAHPCSLTCTWDKRIRTFAKGEAAMSYGWSIRASMVELSDYSQVAEQVAYCAPPSASGVTSVSPIGGFSLAIPSNMDKVRQDTAWRIMKYLTRPELIKWYALNGNYSSTRYSTSADPEVKMVSPVVELVDELERKGQVQNGVRPPVPEYFDIINILGEEIYSILTHKHSVAIGLKKAQDRLDKLSMSF
jgi:multiple sugar transport system substrate-binding protein